MKLGIVGSRDFWDYNLAERIIDNFRNKFDVEKIVSGGAKGADSMGSQYAAKHRIDIIIHHPNWDKYGRKAGFLRNKLIVDDSDIVIAFWDGVSHGTKHTINICKENHKPVIIIDYKKNTVKKE